MTGHPTHTNAAPTLGSFTPGGPAPLMAMVEITQRCDLDCPVCFAGAGASRPGHPGGEDMTPEAFSQALERLVEVCGGPIPLQLSGGEPSLHPRLPELIRLARSRGFAHVELVTNGRTLAHKPELAQELAEAGLKAVYLQFDSLRAEALVAIRGRDLRHIRQGALAAARAAGLCCTLAVAVVRGVNDTELGDIIAFACRNLDTVRAINFQAATPFAGRFDIAPGLDQTEGFSLAQLKAVIGEQTGLPQSAFISRGLGHAECNAICLAYPARDGSLAPLFSEGFDDALKRLQGNTPRATILDLFQGREDFARGLLAKPRAWPFLAKVAASFGSDPLRKLTSPHLTIFAKSFMPGPQLDPHRIHQCCYGLATPSGVWSFCAYNHQVRPNLREKHACEPSTG